MLEVSLRKLTKSFSGIRAVDNVTMDFHAGEIHALLGENGAGKSTLMHLLSGLYRPDAGEIRLNGIPQTFVSARAARAAGIAMVHQHFMLVPTLTVAENILLALPGRVSEIIPKDNLARRILALAARYGVTLDDPQAQVSTLSVGAQQRVEILKALATNARVLILDEPTAVLTPHEVAALFDSLRKLKQDGRLIILITHKIPEVLAISDRLSILRRGRLILTKATASCSPIELSNLMIGNQDALTSPPVTTPSQTPSPLASHQPPLLRLEGVSVTMKHGRRVLHNVSFTLHRQEIIGVAGVDGNGQAELAEVLIGLQEPTQGALYLKGQRLSYPTPAKFRAARVAIIPQDRRREGLALTMSIAENLLLHVLRLSRLSSGLLLSPRQLQHFAQEQMKRFAVFPLAPEQPAAALSGGNQQRVVLARELSTNPDIIIAANPSRGLDLNATRYIYQQLLEHRTNGAGIVLISTDLDEIFSLSDKIYALYQGALLGPTPPTTSREQLGRMMSGLWKEAS
jgi:simple sugar transport system ATP-binding protein